MFEQPAQKSTLEQVQPQDGGGRAYDFSGVGGGDYGAGYVDHQLSLYLCLVVVAAGEMLLLALEHLHRYQYNINRIFLVQKYIAHISFTISRILSITMIE